MQTALFKDIHRLPAQPQKTKKLRIYEQHGTKVSSNAALAGRRTKDNNSRYGPLRAELELLQSMNSPTAHE